MRAKISRPVAVAWSFKLSLSQASQFLPTSPSTSSARSSMVRGGEKNSSTRRSEEHTSELQSLMRISYAVFCLKKKNNIHNITSPHINHITRTHIKQTNTRK